jgi:hypothetical protein
MSLLGKLIVAAGLVVAGGCGHAFAQAPASDGGFLSRFTVAVPFFTRHFPHSEEFDDHNWGGFVFLALDDRFSLVGGDFINSYDRNTALGGVSYLPIDIDLAPLRIDMGGIVGLDLNRGYRGYNNLDPALAAATIKISGKDTNSAFLDRAGLLVTIIPGLAHNTSTALNLALMLRL